MRVRLMAFILLCTLVWPVTAQASGVNVAVGVNVATGVYAAKTSAVSAYARRYSPEAKLRSAIDTLTRRYTMEISDPDYDLENLKNTFDFSGVSAWTYTGERSWTGITLDWELEYYDDHAVLTAYRNPSLVTRLSARQKVLLEKCKQIYKDIITPEMTDYEKELAIHDYIVTHCEFADDVASTRNTSDTTPFTAYGALIIGRAVCQGYTEAAQILFSMAGIESYRLESEDHMWNLVKIGDGYYHLDITWNDPIGQKPDAVIYDYFNLTDAQMEQFDQHNWMKRDAYPKAEATEFHYFAYNGFYANNYTELKKKITAALKAGQKEIRLWVADYPAYAYDWSRDLRFVQTYAKSYTYIPPSANNRVLTLYAK